MGFITDLKRRLFRWQSDGTAPLRLSQRRIFILPTRAGLLFAAALLAMLTGAINYNLALGHALVFLLVGLALTGMVHAFRNLHGLSIAPGRCAPVFAGEVAYFPLHLASERNMPRLALELRAGDETRSVTADVAAHGLSEVTVPVAALRRGWLDLPRTRLATTYPLGLFIAWSYLQPAMRCLIYPQPLPTPLPPPRAATRTGDHHGDGGQEDFSGFRERQPADSPRHVAWKASARDAGQRPLLVKQFAGGARTELQLDWALTPEATAPEARIAILAGWVMAAEDDGACYGLRLPGQEIAPDSGDTHRHRCLEALALFPS
ncbi:MAG: DUF58 domain-containing protein [Azonexus sp.]